MVLLLLQDYYHQHVSFYILGCLNEVVLEPGFYRLQYERPGNEATTNSMFLSTRVFERGGARVVIDELSLSLLEGSVVDYRKELIRSSFNISDNPNAELGCSCGVSFALKE